MNKSPEKQKYTIERRNYNRVIHRRTRVIKIVRGEEKWTVPVAVTVECTHERLAGREYMVIPVEIVVESVWYLLPTAWRWLRYINENLLLAFLPPPPPSSYILLLRRMAQFRVIENLVHFRWWVLHFLSFYSCRNKKYIAFYDKYSLRARIYKVVILYEMEVDFKKSKIACQITNVCIGKRKFEKEVKYEIDYRYLGPSGIQWCNFACCIYSCSRE